MVNKNWALIAFTISLRVFAGEGPGHTHAFEESSANMQALGALAILILACAGFYLLAKKK